MDAYVQAIPTCVLGEGPHWNAAKQELYYVDLAGMSIHRYVPGTGEHTQVQIGNDKTTFVVPVEGQPNKYVISVGRTLQLLEWDGRSNKPTSLSNMFSVEPDRDTNRFNDGKCDVNGRLWAGTMNMNGYVANFYKVTKTIQTVQTDVGISNGIAWSSDNKLMYYIDTPTGKVDVFDFNNSEGTISKRRTVYDFNKFKEKGSPDGMSIDTSGNLWVACWGGTQVIQVNPTTGQRIKAVPMPAKNITSIAFGGPNLDVMYVTSASERMTNAEKVQFPSAGSLFQITNLGVKGLAGGNNFKLS